MCARAKTCRQNKEKQVVWPVVVLPNRAELRLLFRFSRDIRCLCVCVCVRACVRAAGSLFGTSSCAPHINSSASLI